MKNKMINIIAFHTLINQILSDTKRAKVEIDSDKFAKMNEGYIREKSFRFLGIELNADDIINTPSFTPNNFGQLLEHIDKEHGLKNISDRENFNSGLHPILKKHVFDVYDKIPDRTFLTRRYSLKSLLG